MDQGAKLKWFVERQKLSNEEIARLSDISPASLYKYFKEPEIDSKKLKRIAKVLNINYREFEDKEEKNELNEAESSYRLKFLEKEIELLRHQVDELRKKILVV